MKINNFNNFINENIDDITKLKGWVNIKVDEQVYIRMSKHVKSIDSLLKDRDDKYNLYEKVKILSDVNKYIDKQNVDIQTKLSLITILQYLNELITGFNKNNVKIDIELAKRNADMTINNIQNSIKNFNI